MTRGPGAACGRGQRGGVRRLRAEVQSPARTREEEADGVGPSCQREERTVGSAAGMFRARAADSRWDSAQIGYGAGPPFFCLILFPFFF